LATLFSNESLEPRQSRAVETNPLASYYYTNIFGPSTLLASSYFESESEIFEYQSVPLQEVRTIRAKVKHVGDITPLPLPED
jgi:hypothetical protein